MFSLNMHVKPLQDKKGKTDLNASIGIINESNLINRINYWLMKEENFTVSLCKNS